MLMMILKRMLIAVPSLIAWCRYLSPDACAAR
jgi:hypothetical protein